MPLQKKVKYSIRILAILAIVIGLIDLMGWWMQIDYFTEFILGKIPMMFNTGLCFATLGVALLLWSYQLLRSSILFSLIPLLIGLLTLIEYFLGANIGIDTLFFTPPTNPLVVFPGRMAPNTALGFLLSGTCLLFLISNRVSIRNWISSCIAAVIFSFGGVALFGYFFSVGIIKSWESETLMAIHTAFAFMIVAAALFLVSSNYTREGKFAPWMIVPLALASLSLLINLWHSLHLKNYELHQAGISVNWELIGLLITFGSFAALTAYLIKKYIGITLLLETARLQWQAKGENKGRLLYHVSHEIKNPLNAILGFTSLLFKKEMPLEEKEIVESIQSSASHILNLTQDLLALSRLEEGKIELDEREFQLHPWIDEIMKLIANQAKLKNISFVQTVDDQIPNIIVGDYSKIAQIIFNFSDNALKFTPNEGSIAIHLGYTSLSENEFILEISVKDSGPGISPEDKVKLFEPFSQLQTFEKSQGSGLGLTICNTYAQMMKGEIDILNEEKGSTFFAKLRLRKHY